jgi:hypothetical protein
MMHNKSKKTYAQALCPLYFKKQQNKFNSQKT